MANRELVIKIPNEIYQNVIKNGFIYDEDGEAISHAIINSVLLPEGHGDLIDRADILQDVYSIDDWSGDEVDIVDLKLILNADPVVEADR